MYRQSSQEVRPYNVKFVQGLKEQTFTSREVIAGKDARTLVREILAMSQEKFAAAFRHSPSGSVQSFPVSAFVAA